MKKVSLLQLFWTFFKIGAFTFGGGYAMISLLSEELVKNKKWITDADMLDMIVIAESTPGVIAVNTATGVGFKTRGVIGAIISTLAVVLPSYITISVVYFVITALEGNIWWNSAMKGINACVTVLVVNAFLKMVKQLPRNWFSAIMLIVAFGIATFIPAVNVILLILAGAVIGIVIACISRARHPMVNVDNVEQSSEKEDE